MWLTKGDIYKYLYIWIILQKTQSFFSCRSPEALKSQEEKVGKTHSYPFSFQCWHFWSSLLKLRWTSDCGQLILWNFMWPFLGADYLAFVCRDSMDWRPGLLVKTMTSTCKYQRRGYLKNWLIHNRVFGFLREATFLSEAWNNY